MWTLGLLGALLGSSAAQAEDLLLHDSWLIEPDPQAFYSRGVGAPTVAYDPENDLWAMYFETMFAPPDPPGLPCRQGHWGIGRATSKDGLNWTVDDDLVVRPQADTYYGCVVAHPVVIYDGDAWRLWFKSHQATNACDDPQGETPPWGCDAVTGVGYAVSNDGVDFDVAPEPAIALSSFGFPAVASLNGRYYMLLAYSDQSNRIFNLFGATSEDSGRSWTTPAFMLGPGHANWVRDEIYNPSLVCDERDVFALTLYAGGRQTRWNGSQQVIVEAGLGRAYSANAMTWPWDASNPLMAWNLDAEAGPVDKDWRHWDVVRVGDEHLVYFAQKDDQGRNRIGLAYTYDSQQDGFDEKQVSNRICTTNGNALADPYGVDTYASDTSETGFVPEDSGLSTSVDFPDEEPSAEAAPEERPFRSTCDGCATGTGAPGAAWAMLALLALRRRKE